MIKGSRTHTLTRCLAVALVAMYAALSLLAASCPADSAEPAEEHHHKGSQPNHGRDMHSLLCAWSCQANPSVETTPSGQTDQPFLPLAGLVPVTFLFVLFSRRGSTPSRAPPAPFLVH